MADWRDGNNPQPKRTSTPQKPSDSSTPAPANKSSDWRGSRKTSAAASRGGAAAPQRSWTGGETSASAPQGWRRRLFLILSAIAIPLFTLWYIQHLFRKPPKVPLFVCAPTKYISPELGESPFSTRAIAQFEQTNPQNILLVTDQGEPLSGIAQDVMLENLRQQDNWQVKYSDKGVTLRGQKLLGGGPDRNVVSFYINGYLLSRRQGDKVILDLVSAGDSEPFGRPEGNSIPLEKLLSRIVDAVDSSCTIWIALDVRPAPVLSNLGDLDTPLSSVVDQWWHALSSRDNQRTIVTLPGEDGQENWYAPELTSSVFGHFYRLCLGGAFEEKSTVRDDTVTLAEAQEKLNDRVEQWVRDHRFAIQKPKWLIHPKTEAQAARIAIASTNGPKLYPLPKPYSQDNPFGKRYAELQRHWKSLASLDRPYRWDPVACGEVEALLIRMEDLVEADVTAASWNELNELLLASLKRLEASISTPPRASLIEHQSNVDYYRSDDTLTARINAECVLWSSTPPWRATANPQSSGANGRSTPSNGSPTDSANATNKGAGSSSEKNADDQAAKSASTATAAAAPAIPSPAWQTASRDEKCQLIVNMLHKRASENNEALWENTFNESVLRWCIGFVGDAPATGPEWLEIRLLRMLVSELDWKNDSVVRDKNLPRLRSLACARFFRSFAQLQQLATHPNHELSWWLRGQILGLEQSLLRSFDYLCASQYSLSKSELDKLEPSIAELSQRAMSLDQAMLNRDEAAWIVPHMLGWLVRRYQFAKETAPYTNALRELGELASASHELSTLLTPTLTPDDQVSTATIHLADIEANSQKVSVLLGQVRSFFQADIDELQRNPNLNPQSVRKYRLAVRTPLIDNVTRTRFEGSLERWFWDRDINPTNDAGQDISASQANSLEGIVEHSASLASAEFLQRITTQKNLYSAMARGDLRGEILPELARSPATTSSQTAEILSSVTSEAFLVRILASGIGSDFSLPKRVDVTAQWPWSAPRQMIMLGHAHNHQLQIERLAQSNWGDNDLDKVAIEQELYFHRLASTYSVRGQIKTLHPIANINDNFLRRAELKLDTAARRMLQLKLEFPSGGDSIRANAHSQVLKFSVPADSWPAIASLYLGREQRAAMESGDSQRITQPIDLGIDRKSREMQIDAAPATSNPVVIALRGNYRNRRLTIDNAPVSSDVVITMTRPKPEVPTIRVSHTLNRPTNVVVMLDCSESMGDATADPSNPGKLVPAFQLARSTTSQLIQAIQEIHTNQQINLGLVLFGLKNDSDAPKPLLLNQNIEASNQTFFTGLGPATRGYTDELIQLIKSNYVTPSGCTPLYDAISLALKQTEGEPCLIYVVSDGFNNVASESYRGRKLKKDDIQAMLNKDRLLHIYQFEGQAADANAQNQKVLTDLADLRSLTTPERYLRTTNFDQIKRSILDALPRSEVTIYSGQKMIARGFFGSPIEVPITGGDELPYRVEVEAKTGPKSNLQSRTQSVQLIGGEDLKLEFDFDSERLKFIDVEEDGSFFTNALALPDTRSNNPFRTIVGALPRYYALQTPQKLSFQLGLRHENPLSEFTRRPLLVLARLGKAGTPPALDTLLADSLYEVERHYPIVSLPEVTWSSDGSGTVPSAQLTVWLAFDNVPFKMPPLAVGDGDNLRPKGMESVSVRRLGSKVIVELPEPKSDDERLFVVCPQAERSRRQYNSQNLTETHEFTLYDSTTGPATIQLISVDHLRTAVNNNLLMEVKFPELPIRR